jgi:hypothetical protein
MRSPASTETSRAVLACPAHRLATRHSATYRLPIGAFLPLRAFNPQRLELDIDVMCNAPDPAPSGPTCRDLLSSSAALDRAGLQTVELEEAPNDNPNGTRSASSADHDRLG